MSTNQNKNQEHKFFMDLALRQARVNLGNTKENPSVGCVITKNNSVISVGHTSINGRPHAECNAINHSREKLTRNARRRCIAARAGDSAGPARHGPIQLRT